MIADMRLEQLPASSGVVARAFSVDGVPGVLWGPEVPLGPTPLVLMGHPGGLHKTSPGLVARAERFARVYGFHAAAIDAPGHGERERSAEDAGWVDRMMAARGSGEALGPIVADFNASIAERAVPEWRCVIDELCRLPGIDADRTIGYTGMTLATEIGLRLADADPRIGPLVVGGAFASPQLTAVARRLRHPVRVLLPWDDPELPREDGLALFDAIGSDEKTLHAFPGPHQRVPATESDDGAWFIARHLLAPRT
jgi:hypothetical protein